MPTKTRSAMGNTKEIDVMEAPSKSAAGSSRKPATTASAARLPLKAVASEAKRKSPAADEHAAGTDAVEMSSAPAPSLTDAVKTKPAKKASSNPPVGAAPAVTAASTKTVKPGQVADSQKIDPTASRKAAAAFVAARRKMAPAAPPAPPLTSSDASKGTVPVADKMASKTTSDDGAAAVAAPVAVAPAPAAMPPRPFSAVQRGPAMKPRPVPSPKGQVFKTGEFIVYPAHGVGQITAVESQEVAGYKLELFVISFVKDKMILKVPLPKIASVGMRKLAEPPVMKRALDTLTGRARVKRTMWSRRAQEYEAKINSGDLIAIAEVVRDLYRSDAQPEQSYSERQLYEAALDRMARELGVVQKLTDTEALKIIDDQLQKGPRRGKADEAEADDTEDSEESGIGEAA